MPSAGSADEPSLADDTPRKPLARMGARTGGQRLWAIVLAGGEGVRLRPLVRQVCGHERPKQYVRLLGRRTLLQQTLDRAALAMSPSRTLIVTVRQHARYMAADLAARPEPPHVLPQPEDRGTGAAVLLAAHWTSWRDPSALVAVFPSDHFVQDEELFMAHVAEVSDFVAAHPERLVVLGARPTEPEVEYGWVEPGDWIAEIPHGSLYQVTRFREKPSEEAAVACFTGGCLWNTFVMVGRADTVVRMGSALPEVQDRIKHLASFAGTEEEAWALSQAYALMPRTSFSRALLEPCPPFLAVSQLPPLLWSDLGSPPRVYRVLKQAQINPPWLRVEQRTA